ncbi:EI24 domain-containing protein [Nisaea nitritireducens]|uniref:EI24 domain-containing protein n=1 Tax=Nisaea nitritireducens TaxID=568392 RepID=UPI001866FDCE|nr:EI24 domain-containing protein [Nisaea nitritireducens]
MFSSITATLGQLTDPRLRNPIIVSVLGSIAAILLLGAAVWYVLDWFSFFGGWMDDAAAWVASLIVIVLGILFFPGASNAISSLFLDSVCNAVEAKHYPGLGPSRPQPFVETVLEGLKFLGITVLVNIVLLPVYLLAPGLNLVVFYGANGYLLGREFFEMVAMRRLTPAEAKELRKRKAGSVFVSGVLIAAVMTIPVLNFAGPVIATAFMLHRFERLRNDMKK